MPVGPGKYDDLCTYVREEAEAEGVLLIVINGNKGHGFSCQALEYMAGAIPDFLETVAKELRGDLN